MTSMYSTHWYTYLSRASLYSNKNIKTKVIYKYMLARRINNNGNDGTHTFVATHIAYRKCTMRTAYRYQHFAKLSHIHIMTIGVYSTYTAHFRISIHKRPASCDCFFFLFCFVRCISFANWFGTHVRSADRTVDAVYTTYYSYFRIYRRKHAVCMVNDNNNKRLL